MKRTLALAALLTLGTATFAPTMATAQVNVIIGAPPAPLYERIPAPRYGHVWSPGHWEWNGHRHYWSRGVWLAERPGYAYSAPVWYQDRGHWQMRPGAWARGGRDRDRDGIPDRFEGPRHDRGYDRGYDRGHGRGPDRFDGPRHDRDHDGISDRHDRAPNNPYRN